eukprot:gb/GFBE01077645.1/.p1 GENE.gb/GFBE01077645.1/~~gb/GFBE01077645.1/.p1  ORF type:complete len:177 (+),score=41.19 gb/GFBE01077645.1/:1-531(+)
MGEASEAVGQMGQSSQWQLALSILRDMRSELEAELQVDGTMSSRIHSGDSKCCEKANLGQVALQLVVAMQEKGVDPDVTVYNACITACGHDQLQLALLLLEDMKEKDVMPNALTREACKGTSTRRSRWQHTLDTLDEQETSSSDTSQNEDGVQQRDELGPPSTRQQTHGSNKIMAN